jgi:hypothetical protein
VLWLWAVSVQSEWPCEGGPDIYAGNLNTAFDIRKKRRVPLGAPAACPGHLDPVLHHHVPVCSAPEAGGANTGDNFVELSDRG